MQPRVVDAIDAAVAAALDAGADDVEVSYERVDLSFARFARSRFTQVGAAATTWLRVRALAGGRLGARLSGTLDRDAVVAAARGAVAAARAAPPAVPGFAFAAGGGATLADVPPPRPPAVPEPWAAAAAPAAVAAGFDAARRLGCDSAGAVKIVQRERAVQTTAGCARAGADGWIDLQWIASDGDASGYAGRLASLGEPIDVEAVARDAAERAARGRGAERVDPRAMDVVLAPAAVAELIEWMAMASFGARAVLDGHSLLCDRRGKPVCDARVTIEDRPVPGELAFDAEGCARVRVAAIEAGVAGDPVTDLTTAARLGDPRGSTGHAPDIDDEHAAGPAARHVHLSAGEATEADLIGRVDDGLYVTRLHYVNGLLDPPRAVTTGMTRDGTFRIRGGRLAGGVRNLRFTDSVLDALGPRLGAVGRDAVRVPAWWSRHAFVTAPALLVRAFQFTGTSR